MKGKDDNYSDGTKPKPNQNPAINNTVISNLLQLIGSELVSEVTSDKAH